MLIAALAISIVGGTLALFAFFLSLWAVVEMRAVQKSTHNVQFMPADNFAPSTDRDLNKIYETAMKGGEHPMEKEFDNLL